MSTGNNHTLDLAAIRARLGAARGKQFWRCLEELSGSEDFQEVLESEFPRQAAAWTDSINRRQFLTLMGASLALAGLNGCSVQPPAEKIMPYVRMPEVMVPGKPLFFATAMTLGGFATGLLVESHEGRPTKVEGNQEHPASLGASDAFAQASVLTLYDPDRSQTVTSMGRIRTWDDAARAIRGEVAKLSGKKGEGLRFLTETVTSPTLAYQLEGLLRAFPSATWHQYEPAGRDMIREGARRAFGEHLNSYFRFGKADVILSLDADFLACGPGHLRYAREFIARRRLRTDDEAQTSARMNRLYVVECTPTITGAKADHRWPLCARDVEAFARAVAAKLDGQLRQVAGSTPSVIPEKWLDALVRDLKGHRGSSIVLAGEHQSPAVHMLAHAMNHALGNVRQTVIHTDAIEAKPVDQLASLRELVLDIDRGHVQLLVILGGNPVFTAPVDFEFGKCLAKVPMRIRLGLYEDETAELCQWHIPEAHFLEAWSDARAFDGTASIIQPLIAPLYGGKSAHELLAVFSDQPERSAYDMVRDTWRRYWEGHERSGEFEQFWEAALHDGVVAGTALPSKSVSLKEGWADRLNSAPGEKAPNPAPAAANALEIVFRPDPTIFDGRFANNGWLQELPKPLTQLTWDNAALVSPATAEKLGLTYRVGGHGGEHGEVQADVAELRYRGRMLRVPIWIMPGHADDSVTLHLGYGRTRAGKVGTDTGFNGYVLRTSDAPWFDSGLEIRKTSEQFTIACTQHHYLMEDRQLVRSATLSHYKENRHFASEPEKASDKPHEARRPLTMYSDTEHKYEGYKWGMAIDLSACVGCNACIVACQAENNIPVVGKYQVTRGREMHWLRVDRYYQGTLSNPEIFFQPVPCMHCENAPCELVCPVGATVHSDEGLNDMVYNRCVGTRYCSNNCPYKVRRFNFLQYADWDTPSLKLLHNPDVTVRSRGVMEKCTYCVQRINGARIRSEKENRQIRDGDILTACQAACPAEAILFGDLNDPKSKVTRWKAEPLNYALLEDLNTRPRTTYLAALRNPNPEIEALLTSPKR